MAELKGGSTVGGNEIWHRGNHGENSGLDADKLKGKNWTVGATAPTSPSVDDVWIDTANSLVKVWSGTAWNIYSGDFSNKITFKAGNTASASINIPHGVAPTTLVNGDIWTTTSGVIARINGATQTLAHTGSWSTVSQAEAEAGTATTQRLWTAQRVAQAINKLAVEEINKIKPVVKGSSNFSSTLGVVIPHSIGHTNYYVQITPTQNPNGYLGEVWVEKSSTSFKVCCSGTATTTFDYVVVI